MLAKFVRSLLPFSVVMLASSVGAEERTITAAKVNPLPVFAAPEDSAPLRSVSVVGLPWAVKEARAEFFRVTIDGADVWVDSMKVRVSQKVVAHCVFAQPRGTAMAGELGASSDRCSK